MCRDVYRARLFFALKSIVGIHIATDSASAVLIGVRSKGRIGFATYLAGSRLNAGSVGISMSHSRTFRHAAYLADHSLFTGGIGEQVLTNLALGLATGAGSRLNTGCLGEDVNMCSGFCGRSCKSGADHCKGRFYGIFFRKSPAFWCD